MSIISDKKLREELGRKFDLPEEYLISKEKIMSVLTQRIAELLAKTPEQLFSMLYRLDIDENKVAVVINKGKDVARQLAQLIYDRQLEKIESRKHFGGAKPDADLAW